MSRARVVILGGGFAGLHALYRLSRLGEQAELVLADPRPASLARPALPEVALAGKPVEHARFPLAPVAARTGARFVQEAAQRVYAAGQQVILASGETLGYDYLLIAVGAVKDYASVPGFAEHGSTPAATCHPTC
jgi:sulfide:quinone oxidoreductase